MNNTSSKIDTSGSPVHQGGQANPSGLQGQRPVQPMQGQGGRPMQGQAGRPVQQGMPQGQRPVQPMQGQGGRPMQGQAGRPVQQGMPQGQRPMQPMQGQGGRPMQGQAGRPVQQGMPQGQRPMQPMQGQSGRPMQGQAGRPVQPDEVKTASGNVAKPVIPSKKEVPSAADSASIPPVQKQYAANTKIGASAVDSSSKTEQNAAMQEEIVAADSKTEKEKASLSIPPTVAAKVASVSKAAEEMGLDDNIIEKFQIPEKYLKVKSVIGLLCGCLLLGIVIGSVFFSSSENVKKTEQFTIGFIVRNPEVPANRGRCGAVEQSGGCVLYVQNSQRRERDAKDFYPLVEQLSGLNRFQIETANMRYAHKSIKPGYIAQFNIPALK